MMICSGKYANRCAGAGAARSLLTEALTQRSHDAIRDRVSFGVRRVRIPDSPPQVLLHITAGVSRMRTGGLHER